MRNFQKLGEALDIFPLLHALHRQPELWNENKLRTTHPGTPHSEVDDIWLRFNDTKPYLDGSASAKESIIDEHESINYPAWHKLPQVRPLIFNLMRAVEGERLGRVLITRLAPGKKIYPHIDGGSHAAYYSRYHILLQSLPGAVFHAGNETANMKTGEAWWFDNAQEHSVVNNSADDRITMVVDIRQS